MDWLGRERSIELNRIRNSFARLDPLDREVLTLRYIDGLSHAMIAAKLKLTVAAVELHVQHAKDSLRRRLQGER